MTVMRLTTWLMSVVLVVGLTGCLDWASETDRGDPITSVEVFKKNRKMRLMAGTKVVREFEIALGFSPRGHKAVEGDGRTPEGRYYITHRQPLSQFHLSLGISYPNAKDKAVARAMGKDPGGEIFIHGRNKYRSKNYGDWTEGCIAVTDRDMDYIFVAVTPKTPIIIHP